MVLETRDYDADSYEDPPALQESSDSDMEDAEDVGGRRDESLIDKAIDRDIRSPTPVSKTLTNELLATAAALHFNDRHDRQSHYTRSKSLMETRSSFSSPGKTNFTLRQKLSRLSKSQRKQLLARNGHQVQGESKEDNALALAPVEEEEAKTPQQDSRPTDSYTRLKRQQYFMSRAASPRYHSNHIILHVYDLIAKDTLMQLPWGMVCEIGQCFNHMNTALHELGTGVYHVGVEINGIEYAYGATSVPGRTGIFSCIPKHSPGYQYRTSIDFGDREVVRRSWVPVGKGDPSDPSTVYQHTEEYMDGRQIIKEMAREYLGTDYDILRKNCCTFSREACLRLGVGEDEIPSWFRNLAESGALTQDVARATVEPLQQVFSTCDSAFDGQLDDDGHGFEIITRRNEADTKDIVMVVNATSSPVERTRLDQYAMRRTLTWTY